MIFHGRLHTITDLPEFIENIGSDGRPTSGFQRMTDRRRVVLATDAPSGQFSGGFMPNPSFTVSSTSGGDFEIDLGEHSAAFERFRGRILVYEKVSPLPTMPHLTAYAPVYRSAAFELSRLTRTRPRRHGIFIDKRNTPTEGGLSPADVREEVAKMRDKMGLDKVVASVLADRIAVTATKIGATLQFSAVVRGSTQADLDEVIEVKAKDMDIDLPGPDFIVGLCVSEDDIEAQIRKGLADLNRELNERLLAFIKENAPQLLDHFSATVWRVRHVRTGSTTLTLPGNIPMEIPLRTVVPDVALGFPRDLF